MNYTKVTVNIPNKLVNYLKFQADEKNQTVTQVLCDAIALLKLLKEQQDKGNIIVIEKPNGKLCTVNGI
jgi:hypothetical protein